MTDQLHPREGTLIRFSLVLFLLVSFNSQAGNLSDKGLADPVVTPPVGNIQLPKRPNQATKKSCEKHSVVLFNKCKNEMDLMLLNQASVDGAKVEAAEGDVEEVDEGDAATKNAAILSGVQFQYCKAAAEQCQSVCTEAKDYHTGKARKARNDSEAQKEIQLATDSRDVGNKNCGIIMTVANDANITSAGLSAHSQGMGETADSMRTSGGEKKGMMGKLMGPMMGAGAVLGAMCLMGRGLCEKDDDEGGSEPQITSESGIDCNLATSHVFSKCESHFINMCTNNTSGTGCDEFNNLYCGMDISTNTSTSANVPNVSSDVTKVQANTGVGSTFCQYQVAVDYCKEDDTSACPSCRQLEQSKSPVCKSNPALCLPGWTNAQLDEAKSYCPTDPMFITAATSSSGTTTTTDTGGSTDTGSTPPADTGTTTGGVPSGDGSTTAGNTADPDNGTETDTGTGDGTPSKTTALNQLGDPTATSYGAASPNGPSGSLSTSLVGSAFGPSLFVSSSQIYKERCEQGLIDNCGPREGLGQPAKGTSATQ